MSRTTKKLEAPSGGGVVSITTSPEAIANMLLNFLKAFARRRNTVRIGSTLKLVRLNKETLSSTTIQSGPTDNTERSANTDGHQASLDCKSHRSISVAIIARFSSPLCSFFYKFFYHAFLFVF